jgi:hypothetical protein
MRSIDAATGVHPLAVFDRDPITGKSRITLFLHFFEPRASRPMSE